jgi:hypothetical protein
MSGRISSHGCSHPHELPARCVLLSECDTNIKHCSPEFSCTCLCYISCHADSTPNSPAHVCATSVAIQILHCWQNIKFSCTCLCYISCHTNSTLLTEHQILLHMSVLHQLPCKFYAADSTSNSPAYVCATSVAMQILHRWQSIKFSAPFLFTFFIRSWKETILPQSKMCGLKSFGTWNCGKWLKFSAFHLRSPVYFHGRNRSRNACGYVFYFQMR